MNIPEPSEEESPAEIEEAEETGEAEEQLQGEQPVPKEKSKYDEDEFIDNLKGAKVLIVEDSTVIRNMVKSHLLGAHAIVEDSANGLIALSKLKREREAGAPFDLVITDLNMPGLDGFGLLKELRSDAESKELPVVVMSTEHERQSIVYCLRLGISGYLLKPFKTPDLLDTARLALSKGSPSESASATKDGDNPGLSSDQLRDLKVTMLKASKNAISRGLSTAGSIDEEPILNAFLAFLRQTGKP